MRKPIVVPSCLAHRCRYYVLRDDMLLYLIDDVIQRLAARNAGRHGNGMEGSWEVRPGEHPHA